MSSRATPSSQVGYPRKRAQTRGRLVRAGMETLASRGPDGATIGEISSTAGVAAGTFYNHFPTLADLVASIAEELGTAVEISRDGLEAIEHDPAARVAVGTLQLLRMADTDPTSAAAFAALVAAKPEFRARIRAIIGHAIADGVAADRFEVTAGQAATNAVLGTTLQSMRSRVLGETGPGEATIAASLVLRILGVPDHEIQLVIERATASLDVTQVD